MAQEWIKVEKATARKPEVLRISSALGIHPDHAFGLCVRFWCWCDDQCDSGHAAGVTLVTLDLILGHTGFATQLIKAGWLTETEDGISIPHFDYHLSQSSKTRAQSAIRKERSRSKRDICHGDSVTKTRPEMIREDKKEETQDAIASTVPESLTEKQKRERIAFQKPTAQEVMAYVSEIGATVDATEFCDFYTSNGWKVGRNAMKDWRATVRQWNARTKSKTATTNGHTPQQSSGWDKVIAGFRKYDYDAETEELKEFIGPELWQIVRKIGGQRIWQRSTFEVPKLQREFEELERAHK